jgi:hypothetical protein
LEDLDIDMKNFSNMVSKENIIWIELAQDGTKVSFLECGGNLKTSIHV